jgi:hypothetical protein
MTNRDTYINGVQKGSRYQGKAELLKSLSGERLTLKQAILAHCYDCQGFYSGGAVDCQSDICALRPFMPYRGKQKTA